MRILCEYKWEMELHISFYRGERAKIGHCERRLIDIRFEPVYGLAREIHRRDVAILGNRFGRRKWREGTGAARNFERLVIEHVVA